MIALLQTAPDPMSFAQGLALCVVPFVLGIAATVGYRAFWALTGI